MPSTSKGSKAGHNKSEGHCHGPSSGHRQSHLGLREPALSQVIFLQDTRAVLLSRDHTVILQSGKLEHGERDQLAQGHMSTWWI